MQQARQERLLEIAWSTRSVTKSILLIDQEVPSLAEVLSHLVYPELTHPEQLMADLQSPSICATKRLAMARYMENPCLAGYEGLGEHSGSTKRQNESCGCGITCT